MIRRILQIDPTMIAISAVTWFELVYGAEKSENPSRNLSALKDFVNPITILPWTSHEATIAGKIRANLTKTGSLIGPFDLQIAAHALSLKLTLVTNNEKEFRRIKELKIENWTKHK